MGLADQLARLTCDAQAPAIRVDGAVPDLPPELEPLVQSVLAEAVRNVRKHASAQATVVRVCRADGVISLEVENDGVAIEPSPGPPGLGLRLAGLEALHAGGRLEFGEPSPGHWQVRLAVPDGAT
jgi:signal transduction histidine kinase